MKGEKVIVLYNVYLPLIKIVQYFTEVFRFKIYNQYCRQIKEKKMDKWKIIKEDKKLIEKRRMLQFIIKDT